jgi:hypothetical protein
LGVSLFSVMNLKTSLLTIDASLASSVKKNKSKKRSSEPSRDASVTPASASAFNPEPVDHGKEESGLSQPEGIASAEQLVEPTVAEVVDVEPAAADARAREAPHQVSHSSGSSGVLI